MREFFRGWKRKLGVVTLLMACVLVLGWVRSRNVADSLVLAAGRHSYELLDSIHCYSLASADSSLVLGWFPFRSPESSVIDQIESHYSFPRWETSTDMDNDRTDGLDLKWKFLGFGLFELPRNQNQQGSNGWRFLIPYWSMTIPLTLLSAWLLLSKPRQKPAKVPT